MEAIIRNLQQGSERGNRVQREARKKSWMIQVILDMMEERRTSRGECEKIEE